jgi:hypothetical protein
VQNISESKRPRSEHGLLRVSFFIEVRLWLAFEKSD